VLGCLVLQMTSATEATGCLQVLAGWQPPSPPHTHSTAASEPHLMCCTAGAMFSATVAPSFSWGSCSK
jgi:hypothetical protein